MAKRIFEIKHNETSTSVSDSIQKTRGTIDKKVDNETLEPKTLVTKIDRKVNNKKHPNENVDSYEISIKPTTNIVQNYFDDLPQFFKSRENIGDDP